MLSDDQQIIYNDKYFSVPCGLNEKEGNLEQKWNMAKMIKIGRTHNTDTPRELWSTCQEI